MDYGIDQENVTAVTTDTAGSRKTAVLDHTGMEWLPCIGNVLELVMDILIKHFTEVRGYVLIVNTRFVVPEESIFLQWDDMVDK